MAIVTHGVALFPIGVFLWTWKDDAAAFMAIKLLYCVTYSLLYHSHHSLGDAKLPVIPQLLSFIDSYAK